MKKGLLFLLLLSSVITNAQSVKEALFGGKLKNENGSVVKKGDDLSTKIDTTTRKVPDSTIAKKIVLTDSLKKQTITSDVSAVNNAEVQNVNPAVKDTALVDNEGVNTIIETPAKDNNALWKDFVNNVSNSIKTEALSSKKVKNGTCYITVSYSIETDGQVTINSVSLSPENAYLKQQVQDRLNIDTPKLNPVLNSSGAPRKVTRNYNYTIVKD